MLTDSQRSLVERYHNVIYAALGKYHMSAAEYYDVAAERLCKAAQSFHGDPDKFFSYAFVAVSHALMGAVHKSHPHPADIDEVPIAGPDAFAVSEDEQYRSKVIKQCKRFMTPMELAAVERLADGIRPKGKQESEARKRAIRKCRQHIKAVTDGLPQLTCTEAAKLYGVDRSTVLRHAQCRKMGMIWQIYSVNICKPYARYSNTYTSQEIAIIKEHPYMPDTDLAALVGRSANAVHIKRWRMSKALGN